jgi:probable HAF family extracellular repeat protein
MIRNKIAAIALAIAVTLTIPSQLAAQDSQNHTHHHYKLVDLGTLGGPASFTCASCFNGQFFASGIVNERGTTVGWADTSTADPFPAFCFFDCFVSHAFRFRNGALTDLGALTGDTSSVANWISANELIAGLSETGETDPLSVGLPEVHAVLWQPGQPITDMGTLPEGGYESYAAAVNSRGQVVGAALNTIPDSNSMQPGTSWLWGGIAAYPYQTRAFLWDQQNGMQDLGTLPGGSDAQATFVNELGQVVGFSYTSSAQSAFCAGNYGFALTTGSFIWNKENGMQDLGSLGGTCTLAFGLNNQGQVVGISSLAGDRKYHAFLWQGGLLLDLGTLGGRTSAPGFISDTGDVVGVADLPGPWPQNHHAILWRNGNRIDLGVLKGDSCSRAYGVNSRGQVVGNSESEALCHVSGEHAFLWENGQMTALDALVPPRASLKLSHALAITDRGEIVGIGVPPGCARSQDDVCGHAYVLVPCDEDEAESCGEQVAVSPTARDESGTLPLVAASDTVLSSGPNATLSPSSLTFSTEVVRTTSAAKAVVLKNNGTTKLNIGNVVITGTNAGDFAQTYTCGSSLAVGASCSISVTFKPTASGSRSAAVDITDNASGSPQKVTLSGIGTTAKLSPTSLSFGSVVIDTTSPAKTVTLTNVGTTTFKIINIAITGTDAGDFAQTHTCGTSLAIGANCSISVTFKPTASGSRTAAVDVTDNAGGSRQTISLSGTGTAGRCSPQGTECSDPLLPPCCPGLVCEYTGIRGFCTSNPF